MSNYHFRDCRILRRTVQHDALPLLRLQRRVPLRQQERQVVLALHQRPHSDDAGRKLRHQRVHIEASSLTNRYSLEEIKKYLSHTVPI